MVLPIIIIAIVYIINNLVFSEEFIIHYMSDQSGGAGSTSELTMPGGGQGFVPGGGNIPVNPGGEGSGPGLEINIYPLTPAQNDRI